MKRSRLMLNDSKLKQLKAHDKLYKVIDADGLYVRVAVTGTISFHFDYKLNGKKETVQFGRYDNESGLSLVGAHKMLGDAKKLIEQGRSPAKEKQLLKRSIQANAWFSGIAAQWFEVTTMSASMKSMRMAVYENDIKPYLSTRLLADITDDDVRALCNKALSRKASATAHQIWDIIRQIFNYSSQTGLKIENPTDQIQPTFIDNVLPRRRNLSMSEFAIILRILDEVQILPTIRLGLRLLVLTIVRKNLLREATWDEIDFESAVWRMSKERVGTTEDRIVYLSQQAFDILVALKVCAGRSKYLIPSRYGAHAPLSRSTFNQVVSSIPKRAQKDGYTLASFTVDDLRVSAAIELKEQGYDETVVDICFNQGVTKLKEQRTKEYRAERRILMQHWADSLDAACGGA